MKLPIQAQPVIRQVITNGHTRKEITPSDCCPNNKHCLGLCFFGQCLGVCD